MHNLLSIEEEIETNITLFSSIYL